MESLATSFIVSFDYIRAEYPKAADLLSTMVYLDRQMIFGKYLQSDGDNS